MAKATSSTSKADVNDLARRAGDDPHLARELDALAGLLAQEGAAAIDIATPKKRGRKASKPTPVVDAGIAAGE
jgi:hypothetical protein